MLVPGGGAFGGAVGPSFDEAVTFGVDAGVAGSPELGVPVVLAGVDAGVAVVCTCCI